MKHPLFGILQLIPSLRTTTVLLLSLVFTHCFSVSHALSQTDERTGSRNQSYIDVSSEKYQKLFAELTTQHNFTPQELSTLFSELVINETVLTLIDKQSQPPRFLNYLSLLFAPAIIETGKSKLIEYAGLLDRIEQTFGVDREIVIAIWAIESRYGENVGEFSVFETLNTLFYAYPRRSAFFRNELIHFLLICREMKLSPRNVMGSYAGAIGQSQFMPSSYLEYAVSFDGDDIADVFHSVPDILASIANYLKHHHWQLNAPLFVDLGTSLKSEELRKVADQGVRGRVPIQKVMKLQHVIMPESSTEETVSIIATELTPLPGSSKHFLAIYKNFKAITAWNHSNRYAVGVCQLTLALRTP